jgi:hypothetical protein
METTKKEKAVKVTAKDWDRMRGVFAKGNTSAARTIKDKSKAIARFAAGAVMCAIYKVEYVKGYGGSMVFKPQRLTDFDHIKDSDLHSSTCFSLYVTPFGYTAMELGATIDEIQMAIDSIWPEFSAKYNTRVEAYREAERQRLEAERIAKEEADRKEAERMEKLRTCTKESEFFELTEFELSKEEALIWEQKFSDKKKNQSNYRYTNTWHTWQGRIGSTHSQMEKWSEAKQEWKRTDSEPNWRPLAICHGHTSGLPSWMGGDHSYVKVVQNWRDLSSACSDYDNEVFTIYKHPHQY